MAAEPLVGLARKEYPDYYPLIDSLFQPRGLKRRVAVECDSASSLITTVESGRGVALAISVFKIVSGKRLVYRPLAGVKELVPVGIARAKGGDITPAGEKFCDILHKVSKRTAGVALKAQNEDGR
jgi:DNA-binding transcriptional LysR family regulator